ncbi:hypothetical protein [Streptomyces vietnamensis]|uniref:Uncharacterized protein n=1 Tax=Streptomyces vietnamensis TaxID=362257 RepID=A0A0B5IAD0_9ACTN|nr:hypothetical protein [Streptomyces vietnamensis]AJF65249.1 hypothetical protein SVTN_13280 [Streptomyces vietnamensis]
MGTDIHGFVECRATYRTLEVEDVSGWHGAIDLDLLYGGCDYDAFGCLFGVRNYAGFRPLAAERGLPGDVSDEARREYEDWGRDAHNVTWIGWEELSRVDWGERAERVDDRVHRFTRDPSGDWVLTGKGFWDRADRPEGDEWIQGGRLFRRVRMSRRDAVPEGGEWAPVWATMRALADVHGDEHVRLVVWFDS